MGISQNSLSNVFGNNMFGNNMFDERSSQLNKTNTTSAQNPQGSPLNPNDSSLDELARVFNTALIASKAETQKNFSTELSALVATPAFKAVLRSVRELARQEGCSDRKAAESIIAAFRKIDLLWTDYVHSEGIERLKRS